MHADEQGQKLHECGSNEQLESHIGHFCLSFPELKGDVAASHGQKLAAAGGRVCALAAAM